MVETAMLAPHCFLFVTSTLLAVGCSQSAATQTPAATGDISGLSDDFTDAKTLSNWLRIEQTEGWNNNQLQKCEITGGWLQMIPYTSAWYKDYRGIFLYKNLSGNFVATSRINVSNRRQNGPPAAQFSLAGIMVRSPRNIKSPNDWRPGGENYTFLSTGAADHAGTYQFEVKTTINSDSRLQTSPAPSGTATLQVARVGNAIILLRKDGQNWIVHQRYQRNDFPGGLQVGLTCYTDWPGVERSDIIVHNSNVLRTGNPDLVANFDYVHFRRPAVPASLQGRNLADANSVSDGDLIAFLGDKAN